jgi:two-component system NarL family response regulator
MQKPQDRDRRPLPIRVRPTSLILVEGNRLLRDGLVMMLRDQKDFDLLGAIEVRDSIFERVQRLKPQILLLDLGVREREDERLIETLRRDHPEVRIIVMDLFPGQVDVFGLVRAGVSGFILKDASFDDFLGTIRLVASGTSVLPQPLIGPLFSEIVHHDERRANALRSHASCLTRRESEVIKLIAEGLSNKEIAQRLNVATFTVKSHVHNVLEKLTLRTRVQIASYYVKEGTPASVTGSRG